MQLRFLLFREGTQMRDDLRRTFTSQSNTDLIVVPDVAHGRTRGRQRILVKQGVLFCVSNVD